MLADGEVLALDLLLGSLDGPADHLVFDGDAFAHADPGHQAGDALAAENPHQVVLEREVEAGRAGVALPAGPAAELVVDAPGLVAFGADDVEAAQPDDLLVLRQL